MQNKATLGLITIIDKVSPQRQQTRVEIDRPRNWVVD